MRVQNTQYFAIALAERMDARESEIREIIFLKPLDSKKRGGLPSVVGGKPREEIHTDVNFWTRTS